MIWKTRLALLAGLLLAMAALVVAGWLLSDRDRWRAELEAQASALLQRPVTVGAVTPAMTFRYGLTLDLADIRVPGLATIPQARLGVSAPTLLQGRVAVTGGESAGADYRMTVTAGPAFTLAFDSGSLSLDVQAGLKQTTGQLRLDRATGSLNGNAFTGSLALAQGRSRPRLSVALAFAQYQAGAARDAHAAAAESVSAQPPPLFSYAALPWDGLAALDGDLTVKIGQLAYGAHALGPAYLQADLADGRLAATLLAQPPGSAQPLRAQLATAGHAAQLALDAPALDPLWWARPFGGAPLVTSPARLSARLALQGASAHELAQSATGQVAFTAAPGHINAAALPRLLVTAFDSVLGAGTVERASLACLKAELVVDKGVVRATRTAPEDTVGIGLASDLLEIAGEGQVDLGRETASLHFVAKPLLPVTAKIGMQSLVPVTIQGSLHDLSYTPDLTTAAQQLAGQAAQGIAGVLPTAAAALSIAKAMGHDVASPVAMPPNPCLTPVVAAEAPAALDALPAPLREQLDRATAFLAPYLKGANLKDMVTP